MNANSDWLLMLATQGTIEILIVSWQAVILIGCVWPGLKLVRIKRPALRHQIWLLTLISIVALPAAGVLCRRFPIINRGGTAISYVIEAPRSTLAPSVATQPPPMTSPPDDLVKPSPRVQLQDQFLKPFLFVLWVIGAAGTLARLTWGRMAIRKACRRARVPTSAEMEILDGTVLRSRRNFRLSTEIDSPQICGVFRPIILLPAHLTAWTTDTERRAMIQHELAHIARLDPMVNLFQSAIHVVFFFHPAIRYVSSQMSLERELACDEQVLALGAQPETYAECLLKVAERNITPNARYQIAFFSARQTLERRIEMILNGENVRTIARHWKATVCSAALIAILAWLLIPGAPISGIAQTTKDRAEQRRVVEALGEQKNFDQLIEMALRNLFPDLRHLAAVRLTELEGDGSTAAMVQLYDQTNEPMVKRLMIDALARISEIEPLTKIALSEQNPEYRERALRRIKYLKTHSESPDVRNWDVPGLADQLNQTQDEPIPPPPPKPPGAERWLPLPPPPPRRR
jgi:beta-lactamase regulating signal transducer with metallopeptidase domain